MSELIIFPDFLLWWLMKEVCFETTLLLGLFVLCRVGTLQDWSGKLTLTWEERGLQALIVSILNREIGYFRVACLLNHLRWFHGLSATSRSLEPEQDREVAACYTELSPDTSALCLLPESVNLLWNGWAITSVEQVVLTAWAQCPQRGRVGLYILSYKPLSINIQMVFVVLVDSIKPKARAFPLNEL